ncbi:MAG TPA: hypothetical protein VEG44_09300 [Candidatus Acidoferrales bacterium]|nr:hypothetical protein [Candidatus Acidoferrales bacterium]
MTEICEGCGECIEVSYLPEQGIWLCGKCRDLGIETFDVDMLKKESGIRQFLSNCRRYGFEDVEFYKSDKFMTFIISNRTADFNTVTEIYFMKLEDGRGVLRISGACGSVIFWSDKKTRSIIKR